ncbi:MAG: phosphatidate cytidylyltransferase [Clostridia bacterium]|nr:phosphatidate cytidylyltransferase [Clostridia bacterium]
MKKRIYSSILIVITLALLFVLKVYVSDYFFDAFFGILACYGAFEMSKLLTKIGRYNHQYVAMLFPTILLAINLVGVHMASSTADMYWILYTILIDVAAMIVVAGLTFLFDLCRKKTVRNEINVRNLKVSPVKFSFVKAVNTLITFVYPAFLFMFFIFVNHIGDFGFTKFVGITSDISLFVLLSAFIIPMFTDTFAMLTGSLIGGKKLCPKISPNKTISGSAGGVLWCVLIAACVYLVFGCIESFAPFMEIFPIWAYLVIVFVGSFVAQAGDLFESVIKRRAGVSDSGKFLPGHGGLLDRIDSHIYMAPYIFLAFLIFAI